MVVYVIFVLSYYVLGWLPLRNQLGRDVHQAKRILMLIPIELLVTMKSLANIIDKRTNN
jgi:hypothetical protein